MNRKKVCYVIVNCKRTGPMNQTLNIIRYLDRSKYEVSVITLFEEEESNSMLDDFLRVIDKHVCLSLNRVKSVIYGKRVLKVVFSKLKPDVIHSLGMPPYRLALGYNGAKQILTLRNYPYDDYPSYYNRIFGPVLALLDIALLKRKLKEGFPFYTCSKSLTDIYKNKQCVEIPFIRNGVELSDFPKKNNHETGELRIRLGLPIKKSILIYTGQFLARKDQESAIKGFLMSNNDKLALVLCGDGDNYDLLRVKYVEHTNIIFTGKVTNISEYLRASDVYLSTSKSEGLPNSVLEAMASGLPVLLSDIQQHAELFELNKNIGGLYKIGDEMDLKTKIECMLKQEISVMGEHAFNLASNVLSARVMSQNYQSLAYNDL